MGQVGVMMGLPFRKGGEQMRDWLKDKRTEKGLTMDELAKAIGISESYYKRIENGERQRKMDIRLALKLCKILDISIEEIIAKEGT